MRRAAILLVALAALPTAAAQRARYLMGTTCEVAATGAGADARIEAAFAEAARVERMLSTWIDDSELAGVNRGAAPSPELRALLDQTMEWARKTNRAFDPRTPKGVDPGAFGKGYAIDRMLELVPFINFGGQIAVRGAMAVTIADPSERDTPVLELTLENESLSTSSNSEQRHIWDPRTRELVPARGSVSVIARDALTADILSTALFVMGDEEGIRWANEHGVAAIFITTEKHIRRSAHAPTVTVLDRDFSLKD